MLVALRARREELETVGRAGFDEAEGAERRQAFRRVAEAFPGALRELDTTTAAILGAKGEAVEEELHELAADPSRNAPRRRWVALVLDFHATLREALRVKLWLGRRLGARGQVTDAIVHEFCRTHERHVDSEFLERHLHPPGGRVLTLVWEALEHRHGASPDEIRAAVFGPPVT